jgi:hypothetical protein
MSLDHDTCRECSEERDDEGRCGCDEEVTSMGEGTYEDWLRYHGEDTHEGPVWDRDDYDPPDPTGGEGGGEDQRYRREMRDAGRGSLLR